MKYSEQFQVKPGSEIRLNKINPDYTGEHPKKKLAVKEVKKLDRKLRDLQYLLYAENKRSLLVCLQALDAAGKDGTINHVLGSMNPQGVRVHGFKAPSQEEAQHDFLWRVEQQAPKTGEVVIFNRSQYEDVLVVRVHKLVPRKVWKGRYQLINDFEKNLFENGTHILKFFLHISPEEQLQRFRQRLDDPARHWKISENDYAERELWDKYISAYEEAIHKTSKKYAPWFIIPSNNKWFRNLTVARIVAETLESLGMKFPEPTVNLKQIARKYHLAELEEGKKDKGSKKDGKSAPKNNGAKKSDQATLDGEEKQSPEASESPKDSTAVIGAQ
jgi:PPK2 family polyphosphate:nucleotide phosphotransferase